MTRAHKIELWIALLVSFVIIAGALALLQWGRRKPISLKGAVIVQDTDPRKESPIAGVIVSGGNLATSDCASDSSGFFTLTLRTPIRRGHAITLHFRHARYRPLDLDDYVGDKLYIIHLVPLSSTPAAASQPEVKVANIRARYTVKGLTTLNVGSEVRTFQIENKGNVPCNGQHPCSPDGKWKAVVGSASLDAGAGNEFRDARASCIAGPCPFTKIEGDHTSQGGQIVTVSARDWSDTATFLLEAEVFHPMESQSEHWSYPVIFGQDMSFTLPSAAESVSIEADLNGQTTIFPLGPALLLSWANCTGIVNPDHGRVYRCALKPGYRFQ
ncbi:MAG TPA: hypothetical protein VGM18_02245 [Candidatus Sulfotelmatobacter sp.]|jgi:hypothetical protein